MSSPEFPSPGSADRFGPPSKPIASGPGSSGSGQSIQRRSPGRLALRRFVGNRLAVAGGVFIILLIVLSIVGPWLTPYTHTQVSLAEYRNPPSAAHWLGTDSSGRDVLTRLLMAGRVSLSVGLAAATGAGLIGLILGAVAGTAGGRVDSIIMRAADLVLSFPTLVIVIVFAGIFGPSLQTIILALALFEWPTASRITRGLTLSLREREFVEAARAIGSSEFRVMVRHIVPAVLPPLAVVVTLLVASAILVESALSFLGYGVQPPTASWGNMLTDAQSLTILSRMPWLWLPPGLLIAFTVLAVNFVGDGLRDAVDPNQS
jgi:ABC-type dipeptide/oligopeptide/nickel transport system permease subunit